VIAAAGWRWIFAACLPLAACALAATRALPCTPRTTEPLDTVSASTSAAVFALLVLSAQIAPMHPAFAAVLFGTAALAATALLRREKSKRRPLVPVDLLRIRSFRRSVLASVSCFAGQTAGLVALPFHLQHAFGQSALVTGVYVTAWPACVAVTAIASGWLTDRVSTRALCAVGGALLSAGLAGAGLWPASGPSLALVPWIGLCGVGFGLFQSPNNRNMFLSAPEHRSGAAGGVQGTARVSGQTIGASAAALFFALAPLGTAPRLAMAVAAALALIAGVTSLHRSRRGSPARWDDSAEAEGTDPRG
jgi:DHA2 family multidrug resistance protein-like MFS transporter